jgi:hypothetical protein
LRFAAGLIVTVIVRALPVDGVMTSRALSRS